MLILRHTQACTETWIAHRPVVIWFLFESLLYTCNVCTIYNSVSAYINWCCRSKKERLTPKRHVEGARYELWSQWQSLTFQTTSKILTWTHCPLCPASELRAFSRFSDVLKHSTTTAAFCAVDTNTHPAAVSRRASGQSLSGRTRKTSEALPKPSSWRDQIRSGLRRPH